MNELVEAYVILNQEFKTLSSDPTRDSLLLYNRLAIRFVEVARRTYKNPSLNFSDALERFFSDPVMKQEMTQVADDEAKTM